MTKTYPVRFSDIVLAEMDAMHDDYTRNPAEADAEQRMVARLFAEARVVIKRKGWNNTNEVFLTLEDVRLFAREVEYRRWNAEDMLSECDRYDTESKKECRRVMSACATALKGANKVLESMGEKPVTSYWN